MKFVLLIVFMSGICLGADYSSFSDDHVIKESKAKVFKKYFGVNQNISYSFLQKYNKGIVKMKDGSVIVSYYSKDNIPSVFSVYLSKDLTKKIILISPQQREERGDSKNEKNAYDR